MRVGKADAELEFTPLEFETDLLMPRTIITSELEFTPLEFETLRFPSHLKSQLRIRIYSVGV